MCDTLHYEKISPSTKPQQINDLLLFGTLAIKIVNFNVYNNSEVGLSFDTPRLALRQKVFEDLW